MALITRSRSSGFCFCIDPIEKKALNHFLPGSAVYSPGTAGCSLASPFCQIRDEKATDADRLTDQGSPTGIAGAARANGCKSVAFAFNDPLVFTEYARDVTDACHNEGIKTIALTAACLHDAPWRAVFAGMDAANVGLKGFSDDFAQVSGGCLQAVLDTLAYAYHETECWLEITLLLIPGHNDSDAELAALSAWVVKELGPDVPLHVSVFERNGKETRVSPASSASLKRARRIALAAGLHYVYTGDPHDVVGSTTYCPVCQHAVIERDRHGIDNYDLTPQGCCAKCDAQIAGYFGKLGKPFREKKNLVFTRLGT